MDNLWISAIDKALKLGLKKFLFSGGLGALFSFLSILAFQNHFVYNGDFR